MPTLGALALADRPTFAPMRLVTGTGGSVTAAALDATWGFWTVGTGAVTTGDSLVWTSWNVTTGSAAVTDMTFAATTWASWNVAGATANTQRFVVPTTFSAEERERMRKEDEARRAKQATIKRRAEALLFSLLNEEQRASYERDRFFDVYSGDRSRRYRIRRGWAGNVELLGPDGKAIERLCVHPREAVPEEDNLVAQKLMIEHEEERFRKTANITRLRAA